MRLPVCLPVPLSVRLCPPGCTSARANLSVRLPDHPIRPPYDSLSFCLSPPLSLSVCLCLYLSLSLSLSLFLCLSLSSHSFVSPFVGFSVGPQSDVYVSFSVSMFFC